MTTLKIALNYDRDEKFFFFFLSYDDGGTVWDSTLADGGTVQFVKDGEYRLTNGNRSRTFKFDAVEVVLGHTLTGLDSLQCGSTEVYDLRSISFPQLNGDPSVTAAHSWCQRLPSTGAEKSLIFKDPKLGLSNTSGKEATVIDASAWPRRCSCSS